MKHCAQCDSWLPLTAFFADRSRADGLCCKCKTCERELLRKRYAKNPLPTLERRRQFVADNKARLAAARREAVEVISDSYVVKRLTAGGGLKAKEVTKDLIDSKREEIGLRRLGKRMLQAALKDQDE